MRASGQFQFSGDDVYAAYQMQAKRRNTSHMLLALALGCGGMFLLPGPISFRFVGIGMIVAVWISGVVVYPRLESHFWRKAALRQKPFEITFEVDESQISVSAFRSPLTFTWSYVAKGYFDDQRALLVSHFGNVLHFPKRGFTEGSPETIKLLFALAVAKGPSRLPDAMPSANR